MTMAEDESPPRTADVADAIRAGITRGYLGVRDAIEWAQSQTLGDATFPDPLVSHLARSGHRPANHVLLILAQIAWGANARVVGRVATAHLRDQLVSGRLDARSAAIAAYRLYRDGYAPSPEFERGALRFAEDLDEPSPSDGSVGALTPQVLAFLERHAVAATETDADAAALSSEDRLTLASEGATADVLELGAQLVWRWWRGRVRVAVPRERLETFATALRDFAAHHVSSAGLDESEGVGGARLAVQITEYGRARRAAVELHLRESDPPDGSRAPSELRTVVPTEHEFIGDFAADLAEMVATGAGTAQLRLLGRWADDR